MLLPLSVISIDLISDDLLLVASVLVFFAIMSTKVGSRFGVPSLLLFLVLGMVAGTLGIQFEDYEMAESIGHFAMTIILFSGGLETTIKDINSVSKPGMLLSTLGVVLTCLLTGTFIYLFVGKMLGPMGSSLLGCMLIATIMSSTDSASVFSILRGRGMKLRHNLGPMLEFESGSNDPMAYMLTILLTSYVTSSWEDVQGPGLLALTGVLAILVHIVIGYLIGVGVGRLTVLIIQKVKLPGTPLYSILVLSAAFFASGLASVCKGNGLLALYVAAIIIGNKAPIPSKRDVLKFFDGMTWLMQLLMFLMLGILADPSQMLPELLPAVLIALFLMLVARPLSVFACLLPFRSIPFKAKLFTSWVGLRGAGPILFALYPMVKGVQGASTVFDIVFIITLFSLVFQGMSLTGLAKKLDLCYPEEPVVETFGMELPEEMGMLRDHIVSEDDLMAGNTLRGLSLPHGIRVVMVKRDGKFLVPHGSMQILPGDHLVIVMGESDD
ncbi:MAG: potassium/proton antiporter [Bacteroidales bacterium]|nr:potassium/proton antiporter [Bacteroidales bacterium]